MMRIVPSDPDFNPAKRAIVNYNSGSGIVYPMINGENKLDDADKDDPYYLGKYEFSNGQTYRKKTVRTPHFISCNLQTVSPLTILILPLD